MQAEDEAVIAALRDVAEKGWSNLAAGRYDDIINENLNDFIRELATRTLQDG